MIGYYGNAASLYPEKPKGKEQQAQASKLAAVVDAFFPDMYTAKENRKQWKKELTRLVHEAHRIAPGKPVYPYIWPEYSGKMPAERRKFVSDNFWKFELETARECGADGVVIWSGKRPEWNEQAGWWRATQAFVKELHGK